MSPVLQVLAMLFETVVGHHRMRVLHQTLCQNMRATLQKLQVGHLPGDMRDILLERLSRRMQNHTKIWLAHREEVSDYGTFSSLNLFESIECYKS